MFLWEDYCSSYIMQGKQLDSYKLFLLVEIEYPIDTRFVPFNSYALAGICPILRNLPRNIPMLYSWTDQLLCSSSCRQFLQISPPHRLHIFLCCWTVQKHHEQFHFRFGVESTRFETNTRVGGFAIELEFGEVLGSVVGRAIASHSFLFPLDAA